MGGDQDHRRLRALVDAGDGEAARALLSLARRRGDSGDIYRVFSLAFSLEDEGLLSASAALLSLECLREWGASLEVISLRCLLLIGGAQRSLPLSFRDRDGVEQDLLEWIEFGAWPERVCWGGLEVCFPSPSNDFLVEWALSCAEDVAPIFLASFPRVPFVDEALVAARSVENRFQRRMRAGERARRWFARRSHEMSVREERASHAAMGVAWAIRAAEVKERGGVGVPGLRLGLPRGREARTAGELLPACLRSVARSIRASMKVKPGVDYLRGALFTGLLTELT